MHIINVILSMSSNQFHIIISYAKSCMTQCITQCIQDILCGVSPTPWWSHMWFPSSSCFRFIWKNKYNHENICIVISRNKLLKIFIFLNFKKLKNEFRCRGPYDSPLSQICYEPEHDFCARFTHRTSKNEIVDFSPFDLWSHASPRNDLILSIDVLFFMKNQWFNWF